MCFLLVESSADNICRVHKEWSTNEGNVLNAKSGALLDEVRPTELNSRLLRIFVFQLGSDRLGICLDGH
jgi:hypothetical protein